MGGKIDVLTVFLIGESYLSNLIKLLVIIASSRCSFDPNCKSTIRLRILLILNGTNVTR